MTAADTTSAAESILLEGRLADVLTEVLGVETVCANGHFFDDLGADSMLMARFCARVRKQVDLPNVSMKQVYSHPTVAGLAASLLTVEAGPAPIEASSPPPRASTSRSAYVGCALVQLAVVVAYLYGFALYFSAAYPWLAAGSGVIELYLRVVVVGGGAVVAAAVLPVLAKWLLVGRWGVVEFPVWGPAYLRFWTVKTLLRTNPLMLAVGTPLYAVYLRALGADIGPGALILSRHLPACTDLLTVGAGAVIRRDAFFTCYQAEAGRIRTGTVTIGARAHVGEAAVLGLGVVVDDDAWLGHSSSLGDGETLVARAAAPGGVVGPPTTGRRPLLYTVAQLVTTFLVSLPLSFGLVAGIASLVGGATYGEVLLIAVGGYLTFLAVGLATAVTVPRLLHRILEPGRTFPLFGVHYWAQRTIERFSNQPFFPRLLGDSSYVVPYLRAIGYDLSEVVQTGSNFGLEVKHDNPHLCRVGRGTMVADGLSMINVDYSGTGFRVARAEIGADSFLGNYIAYPPQAAVGDDCLLATKVTLPLTGERRAGIGLLGSPAFDIPRSVRRDDRFGPLGADEGPSALSAKNRHNLVSIVTVRRSVVAAPGRAAGPGDGSGGTLDGDRSAGLRTRWRGLDRGARGPLRARGAGDHGIPPLGAAYVLDLRPAVLAARTVLEDRPAAAHPRRHAVQEPDLAPAGRADRSTGVRRRLRDRGEDADHDRGRLHAQRAQHRAGALAGGRVVQVRSHRHRGRLHSRYGVARPLRHDPGRGRRARRGLLPHEGPGSPGVYAVGRQSGT